MTPVERGGALNLKPVPLGRIDAPGTVPLKMSPPLSRVGRGADQSYCLLVTSGSGWTETASRGTKQVSPSRERLEALVNSTDGFVIAEEDLRIRGPGEFFGVRQWGMPEFRVANLIRDAGLLDQARQEARKLLVGDPALRAAGHRPAREAMLRRWQEKLDLGGVS